MIFDPLRMDLVNECLWHADRFIPLTPKGFALLKYLGERPGQLVTKEELLNAVWPETFVSDAALKVCVGELRKVLCDDAKQPRFIETVHRRGYRFVGKLVIDAPRRNQGDNANSFTSLGSRTAQLQAIVGRNTELAQLHDWFERARLGERQVIFVTGESGIGKTSLVETFFEQVNADSTLWIARGQCLEQYGTGEAYLPVLEALSALCRERGRERLVALLREQAPMWLAQMPWLISDDERDRVQQALLGATRERMLREIAEALESLSAETVVVIVLEDLHWCDYSTLDLISLLARRRTPAQLMIVGTYRPVEVSLSGHPLKALKQELQMHKRCAELALEFLDERAVSAYLTARFAGSEFPSRFAQLIQQRTGGNPLFIVNVVDYLLAQGLIGEVEGTWKLKADLDNLEVGVPEDVWHVIEKRIERLSEEQQRVLEAASVAGAEFSIEAVTAVLEDDSSHVEQQCEELSRQRQFLRSAGTVELPDGTLTSRYSFIHALYQNAFYRRIGLTRRARMHRQIGHRGEKFYGERAVEIATELAMHFEQGRDFERAVKYFAQASDNAMRRVANQEALVLARRGLELLEHLPETTEKTQQELGLQMILSGALQVSQGYGSAEVEAAYRRARELAEQSGERLHLFRALQGLRSFYLWQARMGMARETCDELLRIAEDSGDTVLLVQARWAMAHVLFHVGEFSRAAEHAEQGLALYDSRQRHAHLLNHRYDPAVALRNIGSWAQWCLGYPDQSLVKSREALALANEAAHPENLCVTMLHAMLLHMFRRDAQRTLEQAEALLALAGEHGFMPFIQVATGLRGWALAELGRSGEGIALIREALTAYGKAGSEIARLPVTALLAEALIKDEQIEEAQAVLGEVLDMVLTTGASFFEAEYHRLKGELLLKSEVNSARVAEDCFHQAIEISRRQRAKSLELRAAISLSRLWNKQHKKENAKRLLRTTLAWFTEGFDTEDLKDAQSLEKELS
jgi:predicted ATPase